MKTVGIISKPDKPELLELVPEVLKWFEEHDYRTVLDDETASYAPGRPSVERTSIGDHKPKFVLVLGGDGTLLSAARAVAEAKVPILGVNLGSLGFLTEVPLSELYETLQAVDRDGCAVERRSMVSCRLVRREETVAEFHALNDAVINKSAIARLVNFDLYLDRVFV